MPLPPSSLVGSVVERSSSSSTSFKSPSQPAPLGFPSAQHRSKSAFARAREAERNGTRDPVSKRKREVPVVRASGGPLSSRVGNEDGVASAAHGISNPSMGSSSLVPDKEDWNAQMSRDNDRAIEAMSGEERERHAAEIIEQLGPNVIELLQKAREARAQAEARSDTEEPKLDGEIHDNTETHEASKGSRSNAEVLQPTPTPPLAKTKLVSPARSILSQPTSRSSSPGRNARKLRFADVTPRDVHVFQSEPSSPRKPLGLLLPPPPVEDNKDNDVEMTVEPEPGREPEEGTPEDIRRRFFPDAPKDANLEWIESKDTTPDSEPRYNLNGSLIPVSMRDSLPTHLGLHHHGGSNSAGYTLTDLFLLARSSVPAQRATVLSVLSKLMVRVARQDSAASEIKDRDGVRSRALVVGLASLAERGTVGVQAIELVWTCVVYWDEGEVEGLDGVELRPLNEKITHVDEETRSGESLPSSDPISSLPYPALLPEIATLLETQSLPSESLLQLLASLHRFARHSIEISTAICETPRLIGSVVQTFLLTPIPPPAHGPFPNPLALDLLRTLALSSRANARTLEGPADALLRFITTSAPLSSSPFSPPLAEALLRGTLNLYAVLGTYGLYSAIVTTAAGYFNRLSSSILTASEDVSPELKESWLQLLSVWMVCARDPHRTTPTHDLLWSQVAGWAWGSDILEFRREILASKAAHNNRLWATIWNSLASWLEGCQVNSPKAGQDERDAVITAMEQTWTNGIERQVVITTVIQLEFQLSECASRDTPAALRKERLKRVAELSETLADFTRLCLACLPRGPADFSAQGAGKFVVPPWIVEATSRLSPMALSLLSSDSMSSIRRITDGPPDDLLSRVQLLFMRPASSFIVVFAKLSRSISGESNWLPFGIATLERLLPGDEESAIRVVEGIVVQECRHIESAEKLQFLIPFFRNMIRPDDTTYLAPLSPTPESIQLSSTQCLPADCAHRTTTRHVVSGLPLSPDWPCIALDHLLRSGTSPILTNPDSVPDSWNASETDLVQASLSLMQHVEKSLSESALQEFAPSCEYVVFNCMKVFMLEHNQQQTSDSNEEVFRDATVGRFLDRLLAPFTLHGARSTPMTKSLDLETVAKGFLGAGTPFFQFYTDFVALYDAISFSHGTFARLLLPPTSMAYAPDYRKLLWGDFGHTLRTIRTPIEEVPALDLKQFFWPVETDAEMLGWYLRALVKWPLVGFVRLLAVHHIAANIWPDLLESKEANSTTLEQRSRMLLVALYKQASSDVVKDVVRYVHGGTNELLFPPICYTCSEETKRTRLAVVRGSGETQIAESMEKIFIEQR